MLTKTNYILRKLKPLKWNMLDIFFVVTCNVNTNNPSGHFLSLFKKMLAKKNGVKPTNFYEKSYQNL